MQIAPTEIQNNSCDAKQKQRIEFVDLAKGLCILLVVLFHCLKYRTDYFHYSSHIQTSLSIVFSFARMPFYYMISGIFFKQYESFVGFALRKVNKNLVPYLFWCLVFWCLSDFVYRVFGVGFSYLNGSCWFLVSLFELNLLFYSVITLSKWLSSRFDMPLSPFVILMSLLIAGFGLWLSGKEAWIYTWKFVCPGYYLAAFVAMPFFACGYLLRKYTNILLPNRLDKYIYPLVVFVFLVMFAVSYVFDVLSDSYIQNSYHLCKFFLPYLVIPMGLLGAVALLLFAKAVKTLPVVTYLGRYSIVVLVTHMPVVSVLGHSIFKENSYLAVFAIFAIIVVLEYFIIVPFCVKYLPHVCAQKDLFPIPRRKNKLRHESTC